MTINAETAQLILDAIAWCNHDWMNSLDWISPSDEEEIAMARADFIRFCKAREIDFVERKVKI